MGEAPDAGSGDEGVTGQARVLAQRCDSQHPTRPGLDARPPLLPRFVLGPACRDSRSLTDSSTVTLVALNNQRRGSVRRHRENDQGNRPKPETQNANYGHTAHLLRTHTELTDTGHFHRFGLSDAGAASRARARFGLSWTGCQSVRARTSAAPVIPSFRTVSVPGFFLQGPLTKRHHPRRWLDGRARSHVASATGAPHRHTFPSRFRQNVILTTNRVLLQGVLSNPRFKIPSSQCLRRTWA